MSKKIDEVREDIDKAREDLDKARKEKLEEFENMVAEEFPEAFGDTPSANADTSAPNSTAGSADAGAAAVGSAANASAAAGSAAGSTGTAGASASAANSSAGESPRNENTAPQADHRPAQEPRETQEVLENLGFVGTRRKHINTKAIFKQAFSLRSDVADYDVIRDRLIANGQVTGTNLFVLFCAIIIASVGLNVNSTAVIIGAMLVSPLMGTIQLMGYGTASLDSQRFKRAFYGFIFQVLVALGTSTLYFLISPIDNATSELLARTNPSVFDVLIALAGGFAGIVGVTRKKETSNVIPGVAIATALMPPLCTCGYSIANGRWMMLAGAGYLFVINTFFIFLASVIVLLILEVPAVAESTQKERVRIRRMLTRNAIIVLIPAIILGAITVRQSDVEEAANPSITSDSVSTSDVTQQLEILFPKINSVQVGKLEKAVEGKTKAKNIMIIGSSKPLTGSEKKRLEAWVNHVYDEDYYIIYGSEEEMAGTLAEETTTTDKSTAADTKAADSSNSSKDTATKAVADSKLAADTEDAA